MAAIVAACSIGSANASLVTNGDISANANLFVTFPGYRGVGSNPAAISGWIFNGAGSVGVNGISTGSGTPIVPFGPSAQQSNPNRNWAFLQSHDAALFQVLNVTVGVQYTVSFEAAGRFGDANPRLSVYVYNGTLGVNHTGVLPGGIFSKSYSQTNFEADSLNFTSTLNTVTLVFQNSSGAGDNTVNFTNVSAVPEPSSIGLVAAGLIGLGFVRRRGTSR